MCCESQMRARGGEEVREKIYDLTLYRPTLLVQMKEHPKRSIRLGDFQVDQLSSLALDTTTQYVC